MFFWLLKFRIDIQNLILAFKVPYAKICAGDTDLYHNSIQFSEIRKSINIFLVTL